MSIDLTHLQSGQRPRYAPRMARGSWGARRNAAPAAKGAAGLSLGMSGGAMPMQMQMRMANAPRVALWGAAYGMGTGGSAGAVQAGRGAMRTVDMTRQGQRQGAGIRKGPGEPEPASRADHAGPDRDRDRETEADGMRLSNVGRGGGRRMSLRPMREGAQTLAAVRSMRDAAGQLRFR